MKFYKTSLVCIFFVLSQINFGQFHAVHISTENLKKIKFDGNLDDWHWVPDDYCISIEQLTDVISNMPIDKKNFNVKVIVAWSEISNKIYIVASISENIDIKNNKPPTNERWWDNMLQIAIATDYNNEKKIYNRYNNSNFYNVIKARLCIPEYFSETLKFNQGSKWLKNNRTYTEWGWGKKVDSINNVCNITYELGISLWKQWSELGPECSTRKYLSQMQQIQLAIAIDDFDKINDKKIISEWVNSSYGWARNIMEIPFFELEPPDFNNNEWDGINKILNL